MIDTRTVECAPGSADTPYGTLSALSLVEAVGGAVSPETVARGIVGRLRSASVLVEHAEHADPMSLRVLAIVARKSQGVRVLATVDERFVDLQGIASLHDMPIERIPPLSVDATVDVVERILGARPSRLDAAVLQRLAGGSFRAVRWLVELSRAQGGIAIDRGAARIRLLAQPMVEHLPSWSLEPGLLEHPAARLLSLAGRLPIDVLEQLDVLEQCEMLEARDVIRPADGSIEFRVPALATDIVLRLGPVARRALTVRLLEALPPGSLGADTAAALRRLVVSAGLTPPPWLAPLAIADAVQRGSHREAIAIAASESDAAAASTAALAFAQVMTGGRDAAAALARGVDPSDTDEAEGVGVALAVGELLDGPGGSCAAALDALIVQLGPAPSATLLRGYTGLLRPDARGGTASLRGLADDAAAAPHTRARALRALALEAWMGGRPVLAAERLEIADEHAQPTGADAAVSLFLEAASELLRPDLPASLAALTRHVRAGDASRLRTLLAATHGMYTGDIAGARLQLDLLLHDDAMRDARLQPVTAATHAIAGAMLSDEARALTSLERSSELEAAPLIEAAAAHLRGVAVTQLDGNGDHDAGLSYYASAADAAQALDFRLLLAVATYRRGMELSEDRRSTVMASLAALRHGDEPLDGVPGLFAEMGDALAARDVRRLIALTGQLQRAGLIQDAKVLAMRVVSSAFIELPARIGRSVGRLARHRFDEPSGGEASLLTRREREVAQLMLARLSDRAIAAHLGCSPRTASVHVGRILRKAGITSRHQLTPELAARFGVAASGDGAQDAAR